MVYSSSLLEANFVTMAHREEQMTVAEEAKRTLTIQQLNKVRTSRTDAAGIHDITEFV